MKTEVNSLNIFSFPKILSLKFFELLYYAHGIFAAGRAFMLTQEKKKS